MRLDDEFTEGTPYCQDYHPHPWMSPASLAPDQKSVMDALSAKLDAMREKCLTALQKMLVAELDRGTPSCRILVRFPKLMSEPDISFFPYINAPLPDPSKCNWEMGIEVLPACRRTMDERPDLSLPLT